MTSPQLQARDHGDLLRFSFGYVFRFSHRAGTVVQLTLRPGLVLDEFVDLARRGPANPAEEQRLAALKQQMADLLMSLLAAEIYEADLLQP